MENKVTMNRRGFLKGAALAGIGAATAGMGLAGCIPNSKSKSADAGSTYSLQDAINGTGTSKIVPGDMSYLGSAPDISDSQVSQKLSCDVLVIGAGISGVAATRSAAEAGAKVIAIDKNNEIEIHGFGCGVVNSAFARNLGCEVDPLAIIREFERRSYTRVNLPLVKLWAQHSGECFDWYSGVADDFVKQNMTLNYWPTYPQHDPAGDLEPTFIGCIDFKEDPLKKLPVAPWKQLGLLNQQAAEKAGAEFHFSLVALKLTTDANNAVTGACCKDADGNYVKIEASKGVVLTTGGFAQFSAGSELMHKMFCPNIYKNYLMTKQEEPQWQPMFTVNPGTIMGTTGDGQLMGLWIGAQMEPWSDVAMASCETAIGGTVALTVNQKGERFHNEDISIWEKHDQVFRQPGQMCYDIIDANWRDRLPYQACGHRNFDYHEHQVAAGFDGFSYVDKFNEEFLSAVGKKEGITPTLDSHAGKVYAANTLDELASYINVPADTLKATVDRYNQMVAQKRDDDFGCDPQKLFPISTPPFIACSAPAAPAFAAYAGLKANGDLQVLDKDGSPIKGLWTAGNCCGGKFGPGYFTPMPAMNHGPAITHGFYAGLHAAKA